MGAVVIPDARAIVTAAALVVAMVLAAMLGRRQIVGTVILALLSLAWFTVDSLWEVAVLVTFRDTVRHRNGLTVADFVGIAGLLVAAVQLWSARRRR